MAPLTPAMTSPTTPAELHAARARPVDFGEVVVALRDRLATRGLVELVREDIVACGERFQLAPTVARYAAYVDPRTQPDAARELAHQVVLSVSADREQVVAELARRYPAWSDVLRQAATALDLLGGHESDRALPAAVGPVLADGAPRFAVGEVIAVGTHGTIVTAMDRDPASVGRADDARSVVVKFVRARDAGATPWRDEAQRAARVQHPCGIRVLWAGEVSPGDDGALGCVVFERIVGCSLVALRAMEGEIDLESFAVEFIDLSLALAELHDRGLAHGDISPANVLVDAYGRMRLVDYGLAQPITPELAAHDVVRLAELIAWFVEGSVSAPGASPPRGVGLGARLLRASAEARRRPTEAAAFAGALGECLQRVHFARGLVEVVAGASVLFAIGAILGEAFP